MCRDIDKKYSSNRRFNRILDFLKLTNSSCPICLIGTGCNKGILKPSKGRRKPRRSWKKYRTRQYK